MNKLTYTYQGEKYKLDEFYKTLMFQRIMDSDFNRNERDVLLVIFRKTLHFNKNSDRLGHYWLSKNTGIGEQSLRTVIRQLEAKNLLCVERSKGGRTQSLKKFHKFSLSSDLIFIVFEKWLEVKVDNDFLL